jgi:translation initiation factor IF-3
LRASFPRFPLRQRSSRFVRPQKIEKRPRINDQISSAEVLLVTEEGAKKMPLEEAIALARAQELDLIEVSGNANPPIVKIEDVGHFMYAQQKKEKRQKAHSKQTEVKMLRFGFRTEQHDLDRLIDRAKEFFGEGHMVKFVVRLRGRELTNKQFAVQKLKGVLQQMADIADVEQDVRAQGNQFMAVVRPKARS